MFRLLVALKPSSIGNLSFVYRFLHYCFTFLLHQGEPKHFFVVVIVVGYSQTTIELYWMKRIFSNNKTKTFFV